MTRRLYIDTAISGRMLFRETDTGHTVPLFDPRQPHLVRLAMLGVDAAGKVNESCYVVRPLPGWPGSTEDAIGGHGISNAYAEAHGEALHVVMDEFTDALAEADELVAFNISFHVRALQKAALDLGGNLVIPSQVRRFCAMRGATSYVRKPRIDRGEGYQWPKLTEAHAHFGGGELPPIEDPIETGLAVVAAVRLIREGILAQQEAA
jgi:hypothetical protein